VPPDKRVKYEDTPHAEFPHDFFNDLPPSKKKVKSKRLRVLNEGKEEAKLERAKNLVQKYQ